MQVENIEQAIWNNALTQPDKIALISDGRQITYRQLWNGIVAAQQHFRQLQLSEKAVILIAASKHPGFVSAYFGAHLAGIPIAPIDPKTNSDRLSHILSKLHPVLGIGLTAPKVPLSEEPELYATFYDRENAFSEVQWPTSEEVADILFTTGTTGEPKCVPLTHRNILSAVNNINGYLQNKPTDVELLALPISHSFGLGRLRCALTNGQTLLLFGSIMGLPKIYRAFETYGVTGFCMVPSIWRMIRDTGIQRYASQLNYIELGSAFLSPDEKIELSYSFPNTRVCMHYGLTEASRSVFLDFHRNADNLAAVGKPVPGVQIAIFDEQGRKMPDGEPGEVCVAGDHVMSGYLHISNADVFYGDYFRTGDWGFLREGFLYLLGRQKELINVGGEKLNPLEIENVIKTVKGVRDCACIGVPDPDGILGEVVKAFIVRSEETLTFEDISRAITGRIETYKFPKIYEWRDAIPMTASGKIQRLKLK